MSNPLSYISIAKKAGLLETGEESCGNAMRSGKVRLLVLAQDASDNARRRAEGYVQGRSAPLVKAPYTKQELALACGKSGCSMLAFMDLGLAGSFVSGLAAEFGEQYEPARDELRAKSVRASVRRKRARDNDTNTRRGSRGGRSNE